jgi:hypothetical protein
MVRRHLIVVANESGEPNSYPMKEWLRNNPEHLPSGIDTRVSTSHQLRGILKKQGWSVREGENEILLAPPSIKLSSLDILLEDETSDEPDEPGFGLETQLRDFIAGNIGAIEIDGKRLSVYIDPSERDGVEFPTEVGRIDILANDKSGNFYVFELKQGRSPDQAIGQLARYMGWVKHTVGKGRNVSGVIVAKTITDKLRYAASVVPNVSLYEYEVSFKLNSANQLRE